MSKSEIDNNNNNKYRYGITPEASSFPYELITLLKAVSGVTNDMIREMPADELLRFCGGIMRNTVQSWTDNELAVTWAYLRPAIPMLRRLQELVDDERQRREANAELLSQ